MAFYRTEDGQGTIHVNFGRKGGPVPCRGPALPTDDHNLGARCGRMSVALCDFPAGQDLAGTALTCDAPMCDHHRTKAGPNVDHCWRHPKAT